MPSLLKLLLVPAFVTAAVASLAAWLIPTGLVQQFAVSRSGGDAYALFEAAGRAEALWWLARCLLPAVTLALLFGLWHLESLRVFLRNAATEFQILTSPTTATGRYPRLTSLVQRGLIVGWIGLAVFHLSTSIDARARDWPYFRLRSGPEVLPNISFENRMVIRYLWETTPPDARILVLSDQSLFFLGYYLLPRVVLHPLHPESEFTIPRPGESRPAYRLSDLPADYLPRVRPDYLLEYFEGPAEENRRLEDRNWVAWWRRATGENGTPPFFVSLKPVPGAVSR